MYSLIHVLHHLLNCRETLKSIRYARSFLILQTLGKLTFHLKKKICQSNPKEMSHMFLTLLTITGKPNM